MAKSGKIRGITIELNADTAGIMDGLKDINKSLGDTQRALNDVNKLLKLDPENVTLLGQKQEYLTEAIDKTKEKLEEEKQLLESLKSADNASETIEQQKALEREIESTSQQLNKYTEEMDKTTSALEKMGEGSQKASEGIDASAEALKALASSELFSKISAGAEEIVSALLACDDAADKFETAMAKVNTLARQDSSGLGMMADEIKGYAEDLGVASTEIAEATYQAMSAGVDTSEAISFAGDATKLAIGGFTDAATAVDIVTTAINAYGLEVEDSTHIMDNLITTQNLGKTTVNELASSMGRVIPTASAYKVNIDNLSAAYAELTAKGLKTRIATTDLNAMFNELGDTSSGVNGVLEEMSGKTFTELMEAGSSLGDVMKMLYDSVEGDSVAFMELWNQATAGTAAFNIASDGGERFNELLQSMQTNAGELEAAFNTMAETGEMLDSRMETAMENMKIAIGDALGPVLDEITQKGIGFLDPITDFIEENPKFVQALAGAAAGVAGVSVAIAGCAAAVALLKAAFGDISGMVKMLVALLGGGALLGGFTAMALGADGATKSLWELNDALEENKKKTDDALSNMKADKVEDLAKKIKELDSEVVLSGDQFEEMRLAVEEYNSLMEGTSQIIIDETGHIANLTEEQWKLLDAQNELAGVEEEYGIQKEKYLEALANQEAAEQRIAELKAEVGDITGTMSVQEALLTAELASQYEVMENANGQMEEAKSRMLELGEESEYARDAVSELSQSEQENAEASKANAEATKALKDDLDSLYTSIQNDIQGSLDLTKAWSQEWDTDTSKMTENVQSQIDGIKTWQENLDILSDKSKGALSDSLMRYLMELGTDGAGLVQELVDTLNESPEELQEFASKMEEYLSLDEEISGNILETYKNMLMQLSEEGATTVEEGMPLINDQFTLAYEQQQLDADTHKQAMIDSITNTVTTMAQSVTDNAPLVTTAMRTMMENSIKELKTAIGFSEDSGRAQKFWELGLHIDQSIADGISENGGLVSTALQTMLDNAVANLDLTGISSKINSILGVALGG